MIKDLALGFISARGVFFSLPGEHEQINRNRVINPLIASEQGRNDLTFFFMIKTKTVILEFLTLPAKPVSFCNAMVQ
jgi:hypothetical protein